MEADKGKGDERMTDWLPASEANARLNRLQASMAEEGWTGFLVSQHTDLYYLTGTMQSGWLYVPAAGEATLYVRRSVSRAEQESCVRVKELGSPRGFAELLAGDYAALRRGGEAGAGQVNEGASATTVIGTPLDALPAQAYLKLEEQLRGVGARLADGSSVMRRVRMVKSAWELTRIRKAASVAAEALEEALNELREGVSELDWMARYEYEVRRRGHIGVMRMRAYNQEVITGMVGGGEAAAEPTYFDGPAGGRGLGPFAPQSVSRRVFRRNEPILIDIGCCVDGYIIDQTRTAVIGQLPERLLEAYSVSESMMRMAEQKLRAGVAAEMLYEESLRLAAESGLAGHFMGYGKDQVRFLGHGIGLEVDEWPVLAKGFQMPLEAGMVIAVEPKFTFPGVGVIGIENSYAVTSGEPEQLTRTTERLIVLP